MLSLLSTGRLVDLALAVIAAEALFLGILWLRRRGPIAPLDLVGQLLAGALLLLAVRNALTDGDAQVTLLLLAASLPAHVFDLVRRARRPPTERPLVSEDSKLPH